MTAAPEDGRGGGAPGTPAHARLLADLLTLALEAPAGNAVGTRLLFVDGLAGAGKSTLAAGLLALAQERGMSCAVVHLDDVYAGWTGLLGAGETLLRDVVGPLAAARPGAYRRYDWVADRFAETVEVSVVELVVLEGCGSAPPGVDAVAALVVHVTAPEELRLTRGLERDGTAARDHWLAFMADERTLAERDRTRERADVVLDETGRVLRWPTPERVSERRSRAVAGAPAVGGSQA